MREVRLGTSLVSLVPVIRGLSSEAKRVRDLMRSGSFDVVGVSISPEELDALRQGPGTGFPPSNVEEEVYMRELARFGPVEKPPPCFVEALNVCQSEGLECVALDMDEEAYTSLYTQEVRGWDLIAYSRGLKKLPRMSFKADSPEELVVAFDALINRRKAYSRIEIARETFIASSVRELCPRFNSPLALVETERFPGVLGQLEQTQGDF